MKKIPTIFVRDWEGTIGPPARFVLDKHHPDCEWVFNGEGTATQKLDGTCCLIRDGKLYKRHEVKPGKRAPEGFEEIEQDMETGKTVGWVPVGDVPEDKWHREALEHAKQYGLHDGVYELLGPKIQGNPEQARSHMLVCLFSPFASGQQVNPDLVEMDIPRTFDGLRGYLVTHDVEGIVWHHSDGRMAKIKAKDFGLRRPRI